MWWFLQSQSGFSTILSRAPELHQGQYCLEKRGLAFVLTSVSYWLQVALGRSIIGSEASPGAGDPVDFKRNVSIRLQSQDQELGTVREVNEDKAMTKTMINNYTKNQLLPPPEKKKYSQ